MFEKDALRRRGQALEDEFFHRVDEKLLEDMRRKKARDESRSRLESATGIQNDALLDELLDAGFSSLSIAALALVPAVLVAWADGSVTSAERQAILSGALRHGVKQQPSAFAMLESWLHERPKDSLWILWCEYFAAVYQAIEPAVATTLQREVSQLATTVAEASGGYFGRGKISAAERAVLDRIDGGWLIDD